MEDDMPRTYRVFTHWGGALLRITGDGTSEDVDLNASTDEGRIREAEQTINERFYGVDPFPGFHWERHTKDWSTTDYDLRGP